MNDVPETTVESLQTRILEVAIEDNYIYYLEPRNSVNACVLRNFLRLNLIAHALDCA